MHEIKHDGYRFIVRRDGDAVRGFTRNGHDWIERVPAIAAALTRLRVRSATIDGEAVVCGPDGLADFDALRSALSSRRASQAFLYAFDLLELNGLDLRAEPWQTRRAALERLLRQSGPGIRLSEHIEWDGATVFEHACRLGAEGIVSKQRGSRYRSGRCDDWRKTKNPEAPAFRRVIEEDWSRHGRQGPLGRRTPIRG